MQPISARNTVYIYDEDKLFPSAFLKNIEIFEGKAPVYPELRELIK